MFKNIFKNNKKSFLIITAVVLMAGIVTVKNIFFPSYVEARDNLVITFHVASPLFKILNMAPGEEITRSAEVYSRNESRKAIYIKGIKTDGDEIDPKIENALFVTIKNGNKSIYGEGSATGTKTLAQFFDESRRGLTLGTLKKRTNKKYDINVSFDNNAGNEYQAKSLFFDLEFGVSKVRFPLDKNDCRDDGWRRYSDLKFRNYDDCSRFCED